MIIQFDKDICHAHQQPKTFLCNEPNCQCEGRMCPQCVQKHQNNVGHQNDALKECVFSKKIQIETEIIAKLYTHLERIESNQRNHDLLSSKKEESIRCVQNVMRGMAEEKKCFMTTLEEFNFSHFDVRKRLNKIKSDCQGTSLVNLTSKNMTQMTILLSSQEGLERLRAKMVACQQTAIKYQDFIKAVKKYGSSLK